MVQFAWPWMFLFLPLPFLFYRLLPEVIGTQRVLRVPFHDELEAFSTSSRTWRHPLQRALSVILWILLVIAAARPQSLGEPIETMVSGRDLMLAVDISASMGTRDFFLGAEPVTRLDAVKKFAGDFLQRRAGDRVGLILFGRQPYLQAPPTFDRKTVGTFLDQADVGLAGNETSIGDAIGLALKYADDRHADRKVLILLSDGANTAGRLPPRQAARMASARQLRIYTLGLGLGRNVIPSFFGSTVSENISTVDEELLQDIAENTGGRYFRISESEELEQVYRLLDRLEPKPAAEPPYRKAEELFFWPLGLAWVTGAFMALGSLLRGCRA